MRHQSRRPPHSGFQHLWFGAAIARKGWLTRADIINCLPLGKIEAELAIKRKSLKAEKA